MSDVVKTIANPYSKTGLVSLIAVAISVTAFVLSIVALSKAKKTPQYNARPAIDANFTNYFGSTNAPAAENNSYFPFITKNGQCNMDTTTITSCVEGNIFFDIYNVTCDPFNYTFSADLETTNTVTIPLNGKLTVFQDCIVSGGNAALASIPIGSITVDGANTGLFV